MLRAPRTPLAAVPRQGCTRRSRGTPSRATESQHSRSVPAAIKLGIDHKRASGQCLKTRRIQPFKGPLRAWSYRRAEPTRAQPRSTRASACSRRPRCFPQTTVSLKWSVRLPCSPNTHRKPDHNVNTGRKKINLHTGPGCSTHWALHLTLSRQKPKEMDYVPWSLDRTAKASALGEQLSLRAPKGYSLGVTTQTWSKEAAFSWAP